MNIFKALSQGNGRISETNITSFLSYLLNTSNELGNSFQLLFFDLIDSYLEEGNITDLLGLGQRTLRERIAHLTKNYVISAHPEYSIINGQGELIPDVFVRIVSKNQETDVCYLLIENKIKRAAANPNQVLNQYNHFIQSDEYVHNLPIYSVLISIDDNVFSPMLANVVDVNANSAWLLWTNHQNSEKSIESTLRKLIKHDFEAEIAPLNPNTLFILKSFVDYIATEFSYRENIIRNYNVNGFEVVSSVNVTLDGSPYFLRRYDNDMVRIYNVNDEECRPALPLVKRINQTYNLNIDINHTTGTPKNTQVLGRNVIDALNSQPNNA
jgi:hypothetical protein